MECYVTGTKLRKAKTLIVSGGTVSDVTETLSKLNRKEVEMQINERKSDRNSSWDLMHYAVHANRKDIVEYFVSEGYFKSNDASPPYSHVAGICGHLEIYDIIMQHRPDEKNVGVANRDAIHPGLVDFIRTIRTGNV